MSYQTPEHLFLGQSKAAYEIGEFDPTQFLETIEAAGVPMPAIVPSSSPELVLLVGPPASGKVRTGESYGCIDLAHAGA
jgi:hypothetical protein